jgi:hypothetical protein
MLPGLLNLKKRMMNGKLIGFSGKINSGKNFSAMITQGLIAKEYYPDVDPLNFSMTRSASMRERETKFEERAYADSLKKAASMFTGTPIDNWHNREIKEKSLPAPFDNYTYRSFMTAFGSAFDEGMSKNFFVDSLFSQYRPIGRQSGMFDTGKAIYPNWLITDVRFPEEVKAIEERGGIVIRIERPLSYRHPYYEALEDVMKEDIELYQKLMDRSETSLDNHNFEWTIEWSDNEHDLIDGLKLALKSYGVIK